MAGSDVIAEKITRQKTAVVGSVAYDYVMKYDQLFSNVLLPEKLNELSVNFPVNTQTKHFGGCGGNIAYTLKLLGVDPLLLAVGGKDFEPYFQWLKKNGIDSTNIFINNDFYTASAYVLTDKAEHQLTIFHLGAMISSPEALSFEGKTPEDISIVMLAPDDHHRMLRMAQECEELKIRYVFDPAHQIGQFSEEALRIGISGAYILIVNEYEAALLCQRLRISPLELEKMSENYIETRGANDCYVRTKEGHFLIPTVRPCQMVDPTGCGDAFRAGVLAGLERGFSLDKSCKMGVLAATYNLEQEGSQEHYFTMAEFAERYKENFREMI